MKNRREFIRKGLLSLFGLGSLPLYGTLDSVFAGELALPNGDEDYFSIKDGLSYLNTGTMGLSPRVVTDKYKAVIDESNASGKYGQYVHALYASLAGFLHCAEDELALTTNVTEAINTVVWSLPLKAGDEIILSTHEHAGNAIPWMNRMAKDKLLIKLIEPGANGEETLSNIRKAITPRTRVIALPHIPCTIGHIFPVKEICELARKHNCYSCIDGAHGPGMLAIDLEQMGCDFYASCFHKWMLGPKGLGFLYINKNKLEELDAYYLGEYATDHWSFANAIVDFRGIKTTSARRYYYGTQSDPQHAAALESIRFLEKLDPVKTEMEIRKRSAYLSELLRKIDNVELLNSSLASEVGGIVSIKVPNHNYKDITLRLGDEGFRVRMVPESGINCIRISTHIYNSLQEIELFVSSLSRLVK